MVLEFVCQVGAGNVRQTGVVPDGMGLGHLGRQPFAAKQQHLLAAHAGGDGRRYAGRPSTDNGNIGAGGFVHGIFPLCFLYTLILSLFYHKIRRAQYFL